jgi:hypothetical protein
VLTLVLVFFALPETLQKTKSIVETAGTDNTSSVQGSSRPPLSRTSTRELAQQRSKKYLKVARTMFVDPLRVILYLRFMPVLLTVYYSAVTFGSLYVLNVSIQYTFEREPYAYQTIIIGLLYIPNSLGYLLASLLGGRWMDNIMKREALKANRIDERGKLIYHPEDRMRENAWLGACLYPAAFIWYGWTVEKGVIWIVPVSHSRAQNDICRYQMLTRVCTDDREFLLWGWVDAHFCHGYNDAYRIHA